MSHQFEDLFSIFIGLLGFLVIFLMLFSYKSNVLVNAYLILFFSIAATRQIHKGLLGFDNFILSTDYNKYLTPLFLIGIPSVYLYFKSLFEDAKYFKKENLVHFIPPVVNIVLAVFKSKSLFFNQESFIFIKIICVLIYILSYTIMTATLVYQNVIKKKTDKMHGPDVQHQILIKKWSLFLSTICIVLSFKLLFAIYTELYSTADTIVRGYKYQSVPNLLLLITFCVILFNPEILHGYPKLNDRLLNSVKENVNKNLIWEDSNTVINNQQDSKLETTIMYKKDDYLIEMEQFIITNHPFRNSKYSIKDLANDLKVPVSHLSYIFKYYCTMSFAEYKNYSRINDAINLMKSDYLDDKTLESLSQKVGFTSYNPFFTAFKKHTSQTPKDYFLQKNK